MKRYRIVLLRRAGSVELFAYTILGAEKAKRKLCEKFQGDAQAEDVQPYKDGCCIWNLVPAQSVSSVQFMKGGQNNVL